ncbi:hypothetical protein MAR_021586 [Mya arenaria]|uniref:Ig-like domain-containing protein n=1 Tax=Mya arenaria TaxID=6604 RepID=A0ABY7E890_MYAAR|nr:hypothetical protein MAR_021586 [Mya arenaria]
MDVLNICVIVFIGFELLVLCKDNGLNIEFQEVDESNAWSSEPITELNVDQEANFTFQIICRVENVTDLNRITVLRLQWGSEDNMNNDSYTDLAFIQSVDPGNNNTYRQASLVDGVTEWLVVGSHDFNNTKNTTVGVAKPVAEMTCRESVGYRCHLAYTKPAPSYDSVTAVVSKRLSVTMRPSLLVSRLYNESINREEILNGNNSEYVRLKKGQRVMMECDANIGSYNNTAEIHWYRITITTSSRLVYITTSQNSSSLAIKNGTICQYEMTSRLAYELTGDEMLEALNNSVHFQCVVTIPTIDWKTPEKYHSDSTSSTLLIAGAVGGTFVAVVTCLVVLIWLKRKYNGGCNCLQNAVELRQSAKNKGDNDITEPDNQAYDQYENLSDAGRSHYSHLDAGNVPKKVKNNPVKYILYREEGTQLASHASK